MSDPFHYDDPLNDAVPAPAPSAMPAAQRYPYLSGLNEVQREAVETLDGPVLVLAGAGTGKTRVLTTRLAHLLMTRRASPFQMLAVTFTNKAAREMRDRVGALIGAPTEGWWMGTFHALAARILRRHAELVGLKSNFTILDSDDQIRLIKQLLKAEGIDDKKWPARAVLSVIERWKDRALTPDKLKREDGGDMAGGKVVELYRVYQERLASLNACDFGDLLLHNITLFQSNPDVLAEYQQRFRYLLVDEYQDTNVAQYLWLRLLAQKHKNICCVGDDDQCLAEGTMVRMADVPAGRTQFRQLQVTADFHRGIGRIVGDLAADLRFQGHEGSRREIHVDLRAGLLELTQGFGNQRTFQRSHPLKRSRTSAGSRWLESFGRHRGARTAWRLRSGFHPVLSRVAVSGRERRTPFDNKVTISATRIHLDEHSVRTSL